MRIIVDQEETVTITAGDRQVQIEHTKIAVEVRTKPTGSMVGSVIGRYPYPGPRYRVEQEPDDPDYWNVLDAITGLGMDEGLGLSYADAMEKAEQLNAEPPEEIEPTAEQLKQLWATVKKFVKAQEIGCSDTVYQTDRVIIHAAPFIEELCEIVGYHKDPDEGDAEFEL